MAQTEERAGVTRLELDLDLYKSVREYEQHFNHLEFEVRKIASVWILAIFTSIAAIVYSGPQGAAGLLDAHSLLCLIALFGNFGLLALWFLDQAVYHRLLDAAFCVGLKLERRHPEFPPIRWLMWRNSGNRGMAPSCRFSTWCRWP